MPKQTRAGFQAASVITATASTRVEMTLPVVVTRLHLHLEDAAGTEELNLWRAMLLLIEVRFGDQTEVCET